MKTNVFSLDEARIKKLQSDFETIPEDTIVNLNGSVFGINTIVETTHSLVLKQIEMFGSFSKDDLIKLHKILEPKLKKLDKEFDKNQDQIVFMGNSKRCTEYDFGRFVHQVGDFIIISCLLSGEAIPVVDDPLNQ